MMYKKSETSEMTGPKHKTLKKQLKDQEDRLLEYIKCFREKAEGKLSSSEIEKIIKVIVELEN